MRKKITIALLCLGACLTMASQASAAGEAPAWKLWGFTTPTRFAPGSEPLGGGAGPKYFLVATNVGGGPTSGMVTLEATLPEGVTPVAAGAEGEDIGGACSIAIATRTVTCEVSDVLHSGRWLSVEILVEVTSSPTAEFSTALAAVRSDDATEAQTTISTQIGSGSAPFDFLPGTEGIASWFTNSDGSASTQAASHPNQFTTNLGFTSKFVEGVHQPSGYQRDVHVDLPRGVIINPAATPVLCTEAQLTSDVAGRGCPDASQVGTIVVVTVASGVTYGLEPLYNMVPPLGAPAALAWNVAGIGVYVHLLGGVRSDGDFGLSAEANDLFAPSNSPVFGVETQLWGDPSSPVHDQVRGYACLQGGGSCPVERQDTAFLTMPSQCTGPIETTVGIDTWEEPGVFHRRTAQSTELDGTPVGVEGCNQVEFEPTIESKPTTNLAESPSGLDFHLHQPQDNDPESLSTAAVKDMTIALPEGMTLNPSAADGIAGCSSEQIGMKTSVGVIPARFKETPNSCPNASKIGTLEVITPALARYDENNEIEIDPETGKPIPEPLFGSIYLAQPFDNPFDSLLAVYLVLEDKRTGVIAKVPAEISADPKTGQLVTKISENPQLPLEDVSAHFFGGARAPLITPPVCGDHTTTSTMTPWSSPEGADAHPQASFATSVNPGGGSCATSPGAAANNPAFSAGTVDPLAGAYSPFVMKLNRNDATQRLTGVQTTLPPGLIGKLAGVGKCSEAQIAQAKAREVVNQGKAELASPSCPASSDLGTVDVSAGAGPTPLHVKAHAYLAGPYKGAPLSLAIITPAVAGPFDLGAVVLRATLDLDSKTAQIDAVSDPIPTVLEGIPLDVRGASIKLDRPDFTLNPTNCDPMAITGFATTIPGQQASLRSPFQVGACSSLGFKPKLDLRLKGGGTKRGGHPAFQATYTPRPGDANLKGLVVRLPRSAFLDQAHIRTICTRVQFAAQACPKGAQYGYIKAWTPLLEEPLEGPVYLRSSDNKLPDLLFDLHGIVDVEVATRIDSVKGGIRASIESAPDAPLSKVVLNMQGQKKGLIINSRDICKGTNRASVELEGQNGKGYDAKPKLRAGCGKQRQKKRNSRVR